MAGTQDQFFPQYQVSMGGWCALLTHICTARLLKSEVVLSLKLFLPLNFLLITAYKLPLPLSLLTLNAACAGPSPFSRILPHHILVTGNPTIEEG